MPSLVFVYDADSGWLNTAADMAHKLFSPSTYSCPLCELTHGVFRSRSELGSFIDGLGLPATFLHRDEFSKHYPGYAEALPAIWLDNGETLVPCVDRATIKDCTNLEQLQQQILQALREKDSGTTGD